MIEDGADPAVEALDVGVVFRVRAVQAEGGVFGDQSGRRVEGVVRQEGGIPEEERLVGGDLGVDEIGDGLDRVGIRNRMGRGLDIVHIIDPAGHQSPIAVAGRDVAGRCRSTGAAWLRGDAVGGVAMGEAAVGVKSPSHHLPVWKLV
jgi:hypothetical protein